MANARNRLRPYAVHRASVRFGRRATHRAIGVCATLVTGLVLGLAAPAGAIPPPPENPTDDQIAASQDQAAQINTAVGNLSAEVASTQGRIDALRNDMQYKQELSQKAAIDLDIAVADAAAAATAATAAADAATAAQSDIAAAQSKADSFAAASFRQGSTLGSVSALWDATSADELLQRTQLLESISGSQLDVIGNLQRAQVTKSNLDAAARQALQVAKDASAAADLAKQTADKAAADAADALQVGQGQLAQLQTELSNQQIAYQAAVNTVNTLQGQREAYNDWLVLKAAEEERLRKEAEEAARKAAEEEAARQAAAAAAAAAEAARVAAEQEAQRQAAAAAAAAAAEAQRQAARSAQAAAAAQSAAAAQAAAKPAASKPTTPTVSTPTPAYSGSIGSQVVAAAKQWLGTKYVWAGGNAKGPTGGGFDCSGLMLYAYAQVGINMPHYSGYQYYEGARVAKSDLQPGDLVFYAYDTSDPKTIHHVAMYIGAGQMIEAPYTGSWVRIMPLRTSDYIGAARPYA